MFLGLSGHPLQVVASNLVGVEGQDFLNRQEERQVFHFASFRNVSAWLRKARDCTFARRLQPSGDRCADSTYSGHMADGSTVVEPAVHGVTPDSKAPTSGAVPVNPSV